MAEKRKKRPRDPVQLAKLIGDIATGEGWDLEDDGKNPVLAEAARSDGQKGDKSRAEDLTTERRKEITQKAADRA